jgi:hypothetical protein
VPLSTASSLNSNDLFEGVIMQKLLLVIFQALSLLLLASAAAVAQSGQSSQSTSLSKQVTPEADHHQHLFSPAMAEFQKIKPVTAQDVVGLLDAAGIRRAVLLSTAYSYGRPGREPQDEYAKVNPCRANSLQFTPEEG